MSKEIAINIAVTNLVASNTVCRNIGDAPITIPQAATTRCCSGLKATITDDPIYPSDIKLYSCS